MSDLDSPSVPEGRNTGCLSSHPTRRILRSWCRFRVRAAVAVTRRSTRTSSSSPVTPWPVRCSQHQLTGAVLVGRGRHDQRTHREAGHVDGHHSLGALRAALGTAAVVEREPAVGRPACEVGVDDHHRRCRLGAAVRLACGRVQHRQRSSPSAVAGPASEHRPHPRPRPERLREEPALAAGVEM